MAEKTRITIIGGGVCGYPAAIRAARLGAEVTLIEKDALGGTCLNWGCIPTKALLQSAGVVQTMKESETFGVKCKGFEVDFGAVMARKNSVVARLTRGVGALLKAKKVNVIRGTASFADPKTVLIEESGEKIRGDAVLIASGSKPARIPIEGIDGPDVMDSNQVLAMSTLPRSVVIIGGGVIGVEFAQVLSALGTEVTILEMMPGLVPGTDREIAVILQKQIAAAGVKVVTGAAVKGISRRRQENTVTFAVGDRTETVSAEKVLLTVGRKPDFSSLNLDGVGVRHERGAIVVNEFMETNVPGIYAAGDVVGGIMLAHLATAEGECAVRNILGHREAMNYKAVPCCIYTTPEVASVGLTEEAARERGEIQVGRFPLRGNGKALILNEPDGMVKVIADRRLGEVLGVHIIGPHATDMIAEAVLGMTMEMTAEELAGAIHPHPTVSEAVMEAARVISGGAIHMP
ncbi:MAG TPA: dihydrolipoyl dehydrogenase [Syntrophales bacterium]|nr:dihydrolipoyl dehydrogenase [Syntrophales bacterium]HQL90769.1 dihydrolipoyl dehydrogenase [Syntrophales bacterium]